MPKSFSNKTIQLSITIGDADGGSVTRVIEGLACEVSVQKPGLPQKNRASIRVWGLKYEEMAQLTMLSFRPLEMEQNSIEIKAGDKDSALSLVFSGEISSAYADFNASPDVCMQFEACSGTYPHQKAAVTTTIKGEVQADSLFAQFAADAGYGYSNEGVTASVQNAWFPGSPIDKMTKLARDIGCQLIIDDGTVIVLPKEIARNGSAVYLSPETGMIGYPTFNQDGISCRCLFNPQLVYGGLIQVQSMVPHASGSWKITNISHSLSAYTPNGGNWESSVEAIPVE